MKTVMISIRPKWVEKILNGEKTVEVRKTKPSCDLPFKCLIYCTKGKECIDIGKTLSYTKEVVGEFICDKIYAIDNYSNKFIVNNDEALTNKIAKESCLDFHDMCDYLGDKKGYAWHISELKIYDKPKSINEFYSASICKEYLDELNGCFRDDLYSLPNDKKCIYRNEEKCINGHKVLERPPQSWCYISDDLELK